MTDARLPSFVSARMVAERAGVSRSAVSRTFTDGASVSEETRRKVLRAAGELGYHVNHLARGLRERSNIVCLVVANLHTQVRAHLVDLLTRRLQAAGRITMVLNTESDTEAVSRALRQTLHYRADATVVLSGAPPASLIETCLANGQQVILINRGETLDGAARIGIDNTLAGTEAFHLLRRAGCARLAVVTSGTRTASLVERERAFTAAARAAGIEAAVTEVGPSSYAAGQDAARLVFGRSRTPDGVFCTTDLLALGFMDVARRDFALRLPEDLCLIGFDNIDEAGWDSYRLTTFAQPFAAITDAVMELLADPATAGAARRLIEPQPVWRSTVRPGRA